MLALRTNCYIEAYLNKKTFLLLGLIVLGSGILGSAIQTQGHIWGDDFAAYILQAKSIASGTVGDFMQESTFTIETSSYPFGPITTPWGFPLLLAPLYALFGTNIVAYKLLLTVCYMAFLVALFFIARPRLGSLQSLLLTAFLAVNLVMLNAQNLVMSDLPFLMWSTLALLLVDIYSRTEADASTGSWTGALIGFVIFLAAITRLNGFLLFIPLVSVQIMHCRQDRRKRANPKGWFIQAAAPYIVFGICYAVQAVLLPNSGGGLLDQFRMLSAQTIWGNLGFYALLMGGFLERSLSSEVGGMFAYAVLLGFFTFAAARRWRQELPLFLYGLATVALYVMFPLLQGLRYLYPVFPLFFLFSFQGMLLVAERLGPGRRWVARSLVYAAWAGLVLVSLGTSVAGARANILSGRTEPSGPYAPAGSQMLAFVRRATPADSVIIFYKPRAMRLFTDRASFLTLNCEDLPKANYVVTVKRGGAYNQISAARIETCNPAISLTKVFENSTYEIYEILRGVGAG